MGHSTELVKTEGGIKKRIFSLFAYMHYAHYIYIYILLINFCQKVKFFTTINVPAQSQKLSFLILTSIQYVAVIHFSSDLVAHGQ
jgi:hypothetical protein